MTASAKCIVTVEISNLGSWGDDCKLDQIREQARDTAINKILKSVEYRRDFRIIGNPKVTAILVHDDE